MAVTTLNPLAPGAGDQQEVKPILKTWAQLREARDAGNLIPGQYYRITDYVTTVNEATITNARSAGHPFDILVRADSASTLNEQAWAVKHEGDTYFKDARLEAWELKYQLDNVQWSQKVCTIIEGNNDGHKATSLGTVDIDGETYILWDASEFTNDYGFTRMVSLTMEVGAEMWTYDPATGEKGEDAQTSIAAIIGEYTEDGKGTITWMRDEWGNECPYDFKNIQFKRFMATDDKSGREGIGGKYMVAMSGDFPKDLSIEDEEDFIWCYTFSSDNSGGEQTDYSLGGHSVHHNVFRENFNGSLPDNVMFGDNNYCNSFGFNCYCNSWGNDCYKNSWGNGCYYNSWGNDCFKNSWGNGCYYNSWGNNCQSNSWGNDCYKNSWGNNCQYNSWGNSNQNNSWGNYCNRNSWGNNCQSNSWGNDCNNNSWGNSNQNNSWGNDCFKNSWGNNCQSNSWGNNCQYNSWGNYCSRNSWGNNVTQSTLFEGVQYTQITTENVKNVQVLNGVAGTSSRKLTLTFAANKTYTQVAAMTSAGALKIYVPGDLS